MKRFENNQFGICLLYLCIGMTFFCIAPRADNAWAEDAPLKIGVLAIRGPQQCLASWSPTADYLTRQIAGRRFIIVPPGP